MTEKKTEALTKADFQVLACPNEQFWQLIHTNLAGRHLTANDLDRIRIPAGGGLHWSIQGLYEDESVKELNGVVIYRTTPRAYWPEKFGGVGVPPECTSPDGVNGTFGPCATCKYGQWGSAVNAKGEPAKGQACKQMEHVFAYLPEGYLPSLIVLPPTSILPFEKYCNRLTSHGLLLHSVLTRFELEAVKNADGITYSRLRPSLFGKLSEEQATAIYQRAAALKGVFTAPEASEVHPEDYPNEE
jgi:hypothetical protein